MAQGQLTREAATVSLYETAREFVAAVAEPETETSEVYRLERALDRQCERWANLHRYTGEPTGRLREAAMNGWPLPEGGE